MKVRISLVHFLNAAPLGWSFLHGPHKKDFEVVPVSPAHCADQLAAGEVDIGTIPSIEYQRIPGLSILPGISISSLSAVRSVIMLSHPGREIRSVALDTSSRTSVELLKLLLEVRMGLRPRYVNHAPDPEAMLSSCDAALLIGDTALKVQPGRYEVLDLARAWVDWQGTPFTFAIWACRPGIHLPGDLSATFQEARDWGLKAQGQIARDYAARLGLPEDFLIDYLSHNVNYELTPAHICGLQEFYRLAHARGSVPHNYPIRFLPSLRMPVSCICL